MQQLLVVMAFARLVSVFVTLCLCTSVLIIKGDSEVHVMVMQPPVHSLPIHYLVLFDVATISEVAFSLHQLRHVNPSAVLSPQGAQGSTG